MTLTRKECLEEVQHLGKFETEAPYVPYYWEIYLDGGADRDNGKVLGFNVSQEDKDIFPELKGRHAIRLIETDDGFVIEV